MGFSLFRGLERRPEKRVYNARGLPALALRMIRGFLSVLHAGTKAQALPLSRPYRRSVPGRWLGAPARCRTG